MDDSRERLIQSARELLWEKGYSGTSPKAIQVHSGAGQGSMYHHFAGKSALARVAIQRSAEELQSQVEGIFSRPGTALERISAYLLRERNVLRGCPIGRLTHDSEVIAEDILREPVESMLQWLQDRLVLVIREGQEAGDFSRKVDATEMGATIAAVVQGGYVLARAAKSPDPFQRAVEGVLHLLAVHSK